MTTHIILTGTIIDEESFCSAHEVCNICNTTMDKLRAIINEGVVEPRGTSPNSWRFNSSDISKIYTTVRLQRDLQINLAGCALALELLEEIEKLRHLTR
ncbi:MAG: chaperone modulator CbpM [Desulfobulbaceae bacterium]|nr:chaperone modulator CbpM [Desulfobulbaceae bacterium]